MLLILNFQFYCLLFFGLYGLFLQVYLKESNDNMNKLPYVSAIEIILITASPPVITLSDDFDWQLRLY